MSLTIQKDTAIAAINPATPVQPLLQRMEEAHSKGSAVPQQGGAQAGTASAAGPANDDTASDVFVASAADTSAVSPPVPSEGFGGPDSSSAGASPVDEAPGLPPVEAPCDVPDEGAEFEFDDEFNDEQDAYIERMVSGPPADADADADVLPLWSGRLQAAPRADRLATGQAPASAPGGRPQSSAQANAVQAQNNGAPISGGQGAQAGAPASPSPMSGTSVELPSRSSTATTDPAPLPPPVTAAGAALRALREADARAQAARAASLASATTSAAGAEQNRTPARAAQASAQVPAPEADTAVDSREMGTAPPQAMSAQDAAPRHSADAATSDAAQTRGETQAATQRSVQHVQQAQKTQEMLAQRARAESRVDFTFTSWGAGHAVVARQQGGHWTLQPSSTRVSQALSSSTAPDGVPVRLTGEGQGVDAVLATDPDGRRRQQQEQDTP